MAQTLVPDRITPVTDNDLVYALRGAYPDVFRRDPFDIELATYFGQCKIENGARLQALHCYALGNVKATPSWEGLVTTYDCDETVSAADAAHAKALAPHLCTLFPLPSGRVQVKCKAGHPWAMFRAFRTLTEASAAYLKLFTLPRYALAAARARARDPVGFVEACATGGYFTAQDVAAYARTVASIAAKATPACASAISGNSLGLTPDDVAHIQGQVALWTDSEARRLGGEPLPLPEREA